MAKQKTPPPFLLLIFLFLPTFSESQTFTFNGFNGSEANLTLEGASEIEQTGLLRLTNQTKDIKGHAFYYQPIQMLNQTSTSPNATSFSTNFVFAIVPPGTGQGGYGLAFTLSPMPDFPGAATGHYMGIFNESNDGNSTNHVFAVEFDTVKGFNENSDAEGNHVGININSMSSTASAMASYNADADNENEMDLESGNPIQAWIEYDGIEKVLNVTIFPSDIARPDKPLITLEVDLAPIMKETMYIGFTAATGPEKGGGHYIMGWSFSMEGAAAPLDISRLPLPPKSSQKKVSSPTTDPKLIVMITALIAMTVLLIIMLIFFLRRKGKFHEDLEDWELDCPHRFQYKDLYKATKGFKESEIIGIGGFGEVYKGVIPVTGVEVAVKKITQGSFQGLREFAAEIESLGKLRHKNLVNLQGWCKKKSDMLLIYDYIPYGSLYSLLHEPRNGFVLSWEQRFNIIKGIASGLLYLHEEWEQVVVHRDIKSSNVLIDADLSARLGDFGLARLYDHGTVSHTTNVVGTIGYIAPEMARNGRASTSSDVFAYGVLLLEVATGKKPTDRCSNFFLVDWVLEYQQLEQVLDTVDPNMGSTYVLEEVNLVIQLGLLCTHDKPESRPGMRQVLRYLNGDDRLAPTSIQSWRSTDDREEFYCGFKEEITSETIRMSPQHLSSVSAVSFNSV